MEREIDCAVNSGERMSQCGSRKGQCGLRKGSIGPYGEGM